MITYQLTPPDVHFWIAQFSPQNCPLNGVLSPDEHDRAHKFIQEHDRARFIWSRGNLRILLAKYLNYAAEKIQFGYRDRGKPFIIAPTTDLTFNLSHSGDWAVFGVTRDRAIGVDIEQIKTRTKGLALARRFFCPTEIQNLEHLAHPEQTQAFFSLWTKKEAYLKATGEGLIGLHKVAFDWHGRDHFHFHHQGNWELFTITQIPHCASALVVEKHPDYDKSILTHFSLPS